MTNKSTLCKWSKQTPMIPKLLIVLFTLSAVKTFATSEAESLHYLAQSQNVSNIEYEAFLKTQPQFKAISEKWLNERIYEASPKTLRELFDEAEKSFLSEPVEIAHDKYRQVIALALKSDWSDSERKLLFHAFVRTAQTAINEKRRIEYLVQSKQLDAKLKPDENLFPPPLIKEWLSLQNKDVFQIVQLEKSFNYYKTGFINGRKTEFKRFVVQVPRGSFRLTLLSNARAPITKILDADDIKRFRPASKWLARGECKKPVFNSEAVTSSSELTASALYPHDCVASSADQARPASYILQNSQKKFSDFTSDNAAAETRLQTRTNFSQKPFYKNGYFWAAAGAVAAFIVYKERERDREGDPQTHKTGF